MFRRNFYIRQVYPSPKETDMKNQVKVDVDKFTILGYLKWVEQNGENLRVHEPGRIIYTLLVLTSLMLISMIFSLPWKIYYDYKDPLVKDKDDSLAGVSSEATMRRLKYKKK